MKYLLLCILLQQLYNELAELTGEDHGDVFANYITLLVGEGGEEFDGCVLDGLVADDDVGEGEFLGGLGEVGVVLEEVKGGGLGVVLVVVPELGEDVVESCL